jgi:glycosyltransferase involved in cell wall biosynthesis
VTVGFVGHLHLRKGIPYFCEVARRLRGSGIKFVLVGPIYIEQSVADAHRDVVEIVGPVPRPQVVDWLRKFDVLLFPSTCEGSSSAVTEAMASGLPVVCSPNSGSVVRHGTDGFITPYDNVEAMAGYVERLAADAQLRHDMGLSASRRAAEFTVDRYSHEIARLLSRLTAEREDRAAGHSAGAGDASPARGGEKPQRLAV